MAGGIRFSQNERRLPQESGAAPTLMAMTVITDIKKPSIMMKSDIMAKRKDQLQYWTTVVV